MKIDSLYIHFPFCETKCYYCGFYSIPYNKNLSFKYLQILENELKYYTAKFDFSKIKTIYIGGGNPGLSLSTLEKIDKTITSSITLNNLLEYTVECNPVNVNERFLDFILYCKVNRVSLGIQSFDKKVLNYCNRSKQDTFVINNALSLLDKNKINTSIDLINGLPEQNDDYEISNLKKILNKYKCISHISFYDFTLDNESYFYKNNIIKDINISNYYEKKFRKTIKEYGFKRYEISNYSLKNRESIHNLTYWNYNNYIGLGPSAHSTVGDIRIENTPDLKIYIKEKCYFKKEKLSINDQIKEYILMGLRLIKGIDIDDFHEKFNYDFKDLFSKTIKLYKDQKVFIFKNNIFKLSSRGLDLLNKILVDLFIELDN